MLMFNGLGPQMTTKVHTPPLAGKYVINTFKHVMQAWLYIV